MTYADFEEACKYWKGVAAARLKEIERLENLLANADLCAVCGLDYGDNLSRWRIADCKCDEVVE
jgi:hypothetical protein